MNPDPNTARVICAECNGAHDAKPDGGRCGHCGAKALMYHTGCGDHAFYKGHSGTDKAHAVAGRLRADLLYEAGALTCISGFTATDAAGMAANMRNAMGGDAAARIRSVAYRLNLIACAIEAVDDEHAPRKATGDAVGRMIAADRKRIRCHNHPITAGQNQA